ncbi:uncharacterized protein HKW66_Vig0204050 [Vigna angularis]|uniref:Uncharacterized protein n=1 Tax=Phaseolus angularis TaxID=3914 RepID=A0A8T0JS93_PHAAN|nr:uncharacterized protein HKW66_Vig0204050 [Vigna angularis]
MQVHMKKFSTEGYLVNHKTQILVVTIMMYDAVVLLQFEEYKCKKKHELYISCLFVTRSN